MKVGVEGTPFFGNLTGIGQYSSRLIDAAQSLSRDDDFEIVKQWWFYRRFIPPIRPSQHLSYRLVKWVPPLFYYQLFKRVGWAPPYDLLALRRYDAFIFFNYVAFPLRRKTKSLVVIYDLSFVHHPEFTHEKNLLYMPKFVPLSIKKADCIITISENSKREVMEYYHVPDDKITVINPAVDHAVFRPQSQAAVKAVCRKYKINKPYILSVCTLEPRKNLIGVLEAFEKLPEDIKNSHSLVLVGGKGWLDGELEAKYEQLAEKYDLIKTGYAPDEDLPALYSGASVFVFPSFYEGFGMPPLEAMACGVPVITADNSSLPEVVGDAAIMIKAENTQRLAKEVERVLTDDKLAKSLREKGLKQAAKFSWGKSARTLITLLNSLKN
jgi:glycosyltransferase involved in cell wall biosynthesis